MVERGSEEGAGNDIEEEGRDDGLLLFGRQLSRQALPIWKYREQLLYMVESHPVVVVIGHTGCGKSTQIPQFLREAGWGETNIIACTQPRRIAAISIAQKVSQEINCTLGEEVGYSIRFNDLTCAKTKIKYMTDGMLVREALNDPLLSRYSIIMVDEAHERSLYTDILLGLLKKIQKRRADLKLIISSATLQAETFASFFGVNTGIISLEGKSYPVDILYLPPDESTSNYVEKTIQTVFSISEKEPPGDILCFLTGREEIDYCKAQITERIATQRYKANQTLVPMALYAGLSQDMQLAVFEQLGSEFRKVIFATNIAEASITIDGIVYVIDCGLVKIRAFNPTNSTERLTVTPISKSSAKQRAGRAGRTQKGTCLRLYTEEDFSTLENSTTPEVQRSDLSSVILQLKALGIDNINKFNFLSSPPAEMVIHSMQFLYSLGALDDYAKLTEPLGRHIAELPLEPKLAKILLVSKEYDCVQQILTIAAIMSVENIFLSIGGDKKSADHVRRKFVAEEGDHLTYLNIYQSFIKSGKSSKWCHDNYFNYKALLQVVSVRKQLKRYLERFNIKMTTARDSSSPFIVEAIQKCLVSGYFSQVARMQPDGTFRSVNDAAKPLYAHPHSVFFSRKCDWAIYSDVVESGEGGEGGVKAYMRGITAVEKKWIIEGGSHYFDVRDTNMR